MNKILLVTTSLAGAVVALSYSASLEASGGTAPYSFKITDGSLPDGLSLADTGTISGTPTGLSSSFSVVATDATGEVSDPVSLSISVQPAADSSAAGAVSETDPAPEPVAEAEPAAEPQPEPTATEQPAHETLCQEIEDKLHELHDHVVSAAEKAEADAEAVIRGAYADLVKAATRVREVLGGAAS